MKKLITLLLALITTTYTYSQNDVAYPHVIAMTPNSAEIAKYTDYPVSYYTGTPNISLPIYEIEVDGLKIPINLNYHASGIRVDQEATWAGLGWSLDVGSTISRSVKSADDFRMFWDKNFPHVIQGYFDAPDISSNRDNHYELNGYPSCPPVWAELQYDLIYDPEPDIFYYALPGYSGKFILDKSRGAKLFDKSHNLKIEVLKNSGSVKFIVTDKEGVQYLYNQWETTESYTSNGWLNKNIHASNTKYDDNTSDYTHWTQFRNDDCSIEMVPNPQSPHPVVTSWYVSKIITKNGKEINFNYVTESQYLPTYESAEKYNYNNTSKLFYNKSKIVNTALRLTSISGDFGLIQFHSSDRYDIKGTSKKLDAINIYNNLDDLVKSFKFNYSYFNDDYSGNYQYEHVFKRLKLNSLREYSSANLPLNDGFIFNYYPGNFPAKNSKDVDYRGFQNGKIYGENYYIGLKINNELYSGVKKEFNFDKAIIGTIKSITYPTGGKAEFKFEGNKISSGYLEGNTYEWLPSTPSNNNLLSLDVFNYYNSIDYDLYSDLPSQMVTTFEIQEQTNIKINAQLENTMQTRDMTYYYESYSNPLGVLRRINPSTFTYYTYLSPLLWDPSSSQPQGVGSEVIFAERQYTLQAGTYQFEAYKPPRDVLVSWRLSFDRPLPTSSTGTGTGTNTVVGTGPFDGGGIRIKQIITDATTRNFRYPTGVMLKEPVLYYLGRREGIPDYIANSLVQVSESKTPLSTFNRGDFIGYGWVEEWAYDQEDDISKTKYTFFNEPETEMFDDSFPDSPYYLNYINGLIKTIELYKTVSQGNPILVNKEEFSYTSTFSNIIHAFRDRGIKRNTNDVLPYYYQIEWPLKTKKVETLITDDNKSVVKETNYGYNSKDLLQSTSQQIDNSLITEKINYPFDFPSDGVSQNMVLKNILGIPIETITLKDNKLLQATKTQFYDFSGLYLPKSIKKTELNSTNLSELNRDAYYQSYLDFHDYDSEGNLLAVSKLNGSHTFYVWGYFQEYPIAKIENFNAQVGLTSTIQGLITAAQNDSDDDVDHCIDTGSCNEKNLRTSLAAIRNALPNSMVTTYTYNPLIGMTSMTDPTGYTIYYEYDAFNRLKQVKDANGNILSETKYNYK